MPTIKELKAMLKKAKQEQGQCLPYSKLKKKELMERATSIGLITPINTSEKTLKKTLGIKARPNNLAEPPEKKKVKTTRKEKIDELRSKIEKTRAEQTGKTKTLLTVLLKNVDDLYDPVLSKESVMRGIRKIKDRFKEILG